MIEDYEMTLEAEEVTAPELIADDEARADLEAILEGIAAEYGLRTALDVADAVRTAAYAGQIDGRHYVACEVGQTVCVIGHVALLLNSYEEDNSERPVVPGWSYYRQGLSPLEYHVAGVRPGDTPATDSYLFTMAHWLDSWTAQRA